MKNQIRNHLTHLASLDKRTLLFLTIISVFEIICLVCIMTLSYESVKEWISVLPIANFPFLASLVNFIFVFFISAMIWLATDRTMYLLGVLARAKQSGLKDIWGESTDFIQYLGQTTLVMSLAIGVIVLSLHFSTTGAGMQLTKSLSEISLETDNEISRKFQEKEREIINHYEHLKAKEEKKYNRLISYRSVELAQEAIADLERSKQKALQVLRNEKLSALKNAEQARQDLLEKTKAKKDSGKYVGISFEFLAVICAIAIQILARGKREISSNERNFNEISNEISNETFLKEKRKAEILQFYDKVGKGKLFKTQKELANHIGESEVYISRVFAEERERRASLNGKSYTWSIGDNMFQ